MTTPKEEAVSALATAQKMLDNPEALVGHRLAMLRATVEYAASQVEAIQALKRERSRTPRARSAPAPAPAQHDLPGHGARP